jgi:hypothetical protein
MKKIVIAYHGYMFGSRYMEMMAAQFRLLLTTGLYQASSKIYFGIVEDENRKPLNGNAWIHDFWKFGSSKEKGQILSKVEIVFYPENRELRDTLHWIKDYARENPDDYILFFHSKGITHYTESTEDWRRYMEYFVIEKWKDCIAKLDEGHDCCGVLWNKDTPLGYFPHFSGAFFWAKAGYINTLNHDYIDSAWRYHMEFWIGSNPNAKIFEFHNSRLNDKDSLIANKGHYSIQYPRNMYTNE